MHLVGVRQVLQVADEDAPGGLRDVEPLVRVKRDRVRALDAGQLRPQVGGEDGRPAVRGVHMQPDALIRAHARDVGDRIDRPRRQLDLARGGR